MKKIKQKPNGYTLLEVTVATGLFAFMLLTVLSIFQSVNEGQKNAIAMQNLQENLHYSLEVMSKEIRQAVRSDNTCLGGAASADINNGAGLNRVYNEITSGVNQGFHFKKIDKEGHEVCVRYYLDGQRLKIRRIDKTNASTLLVDDFIVPNEIAISNLIFGIYDNRDTELPENKIQPRVNLRFGAAMTTGDPKYRGPFNIQTTITSRTYGDDLYDD